MPDLQDELSLVRKLQNLVVLVRISTQPDVVLIVDEDAMFRGEPFVSLSCATPRLEELSVRVEFQHGWRGNAALRLWRFESGGLLAIRNCCGAMKDPNVVVGIDGDAAHLSCHPFVR